MNIELNQIECRILGALAEKSITVKDQYPLSFNSLMLACNQKSSRDPVMSLDVQTLGKGINSLLEKGLVQKHLFSGERSVKYTHCLSTLLDTLDARITAVAIVLMLRGPQTAAEIKTRTERLYQFADTAEVEELIKNLSAAEKPFVAKAPRRPGQKDGRYVHLFCGIPEEGNFPAEEKKTLVFADKTDERLSLLEKKINAIEKWLAEFSEGSFKPYEQPEKADENASGKVLDPAAETVSSESAGLAGTAASEVSVSNENSEKNSINALSGNTGHDAPPGSII